MFEKYTFFKKTSNFLQQMHKICKKQEMTYLTYRRFLSFIECKMVIMRLSPHNHHVFMGGELFIALRAL